MIQGYCRTNLDGYEAERWPTEFVAVPREGEYVESKNGKRLKVCRVTHTMTKCYRDNPPIIEVELTRSV